MDDGRADPARRAPPPAGHGQGQPPRAPAVAMDLSSQFHRRFPQFLPPVAPRLPSLASGSGSAFSYYQVPPALAPAPGGSGGSGDGSHHARSLSHPPFLSVEPLNQPPPAAEQGPSSAPGLPPHGAGHRRSRSDFLVGFSRPNFGLTVPQMASGPSAEAFKSVDAAALEELFGPYRELRGMGVLGPSGDAADERPDHLGGPRAWSPAESSENEAESWGTGGGGGPSHPRHCRSLSVDSIMGSLNFGALGQESPRLPPPSPGAGAGGSFSRAGSGPADGAGALAATELGNGEFNEAEMKKIMANDRLAEIALADPKRVKRILANRVSAARSKERKVKYMIELERKVHVLQMEATTLSAKMTMTQRESAALKTQNNEMKIRLQAMEQQAQLKNALNEALAAEVQRLKHAAGETSDPRTPNGSQQHVSCQMIQQQQLQLQKQPSEPQQAQQQQPEKSEKFKAQEQQY